MAGAVGFHIREGYFYQFMAKAVVVAAGTFALPPKTYHYPGATGMAMALRAGAKLINMEQGKGFQCEIAGPSRGGHCSSMTCYFYGYNEWWGQKFVNAKGEEFMEKYDLGRRLPGRRHWGPPWRLFIPAIYQEWKEGKGPCYMDISTCSDYSERLRDAYGGYCDDHVREFDYLAKIRNTLPLREFWKTKWELRLGNAGLEIGGGIRVNANSETHVSGLYAAGVVADTCGGAGYASAASLAACFTQGHRAGINAAQYASSQPKPALDEGQAKRLKQKVYAPLERKKGVAPDDLLAKVALIVYASDTIKNEIRLKKAIEEFQQIEQEAANLVAKDYHYLGKCHRAKDTLALYDIVARTSLMRTESRGNHYREDFPLTDNDNWLKWLTVGVVDGETRITPEEVPFEEKGWKHRPNSGKINIWRLNK